MHYCYCAGERRGRGNYSSTPHMGTQGFQLVSCSCQWGNNLPAPGRAHGHNYFITRSTNFTAVRLSVTISQPLVTLTKRAHRSRPPRLLQEEHGYLERGACSLWVYTFEFGPRVNSEAVLLCVASRASADVASAA